MKKILVVLLVVAQLAAMSCSSKTIDVNSVRTNAGLVSGTLSEDGTVKIFMGIPFAAPPVGDLRWKAPRPAIPWEGVRECVDLPPSAMQAPPIPFRMWSQEFMAPMEPLSEDCLYLNVWTAAEKSNEHLPVILWIHGGAFTGGSGTVPLYDGTDMAKKGVVFVTTNYRLGIFGFFCHPELTAESELGVSGNYGILDQIAALQWVKDNIEAFGGDPMNITIAGQSAGSMSVNAIMASPLAKGLFQRAIGQSGGSFSEVLSPASTLDSVQQMNLRYTRSLGMTIADMRALSADSVMKLRTRSGTVIDNVVIPHIYATFKEGEQSDVPLLTGWNEGDGAALGAANGIWARMQAESGSQPSYLYYFRRVPPGEPNYGAFHSAEFGYALNTLQLWDRPFTDWDYQLEDIMSTYWVNFAANGDPNGVGLMEWPEFDPSDPKMMVFGDAVEVADFVPPTNQGSFFGN
ncbi:MAG TPA: carboxylesterase family protein [Bacteroidetes bacterium]|nr:carboxylesterase family protein [Bacteroidota bacterium]